MDGGEFNRRCYFLRPNRVTGAQGDERIAGYAQSSLEWGALRPAGRSTGTTGQGDAIGVGTHVLTVQKNASVDDVGTDWRVQVDGKVYEIKGPPREAGEVGELLEFDVARKGGTWRRR